MVVAIITILFFITSQSQCFSEIFEAGPSVLTCIISSGVPFSEVINFSPGQNISENMLCFSKCVGEKVGLITGGTMHPNKLSAIPLLPSVPDSVYQNAQHCLENLNTRIESCQDMLDAEKCIEKLYMSYD